jgi:hypothetical protein
MSGGRRMENAGWLKIEINKALAELKTINIYRDPGKEPKPHATEAKARAHLNPDELADMDTINHVRRELRAKLDEASFLRKRLIGRGLERGKAKAEAAKAAAEKGPSE